MKKLALPDSRFRVNDKLATLSLPSHIIAYKATVDVDSAKENVLVWRLRKPADTELSTITKTSESTQFLKVTETFVKESAHFFVTDAPSAGTLYEYMQKHGPLSEAAIRSIMNQLLATCDFLQRKRMSHLCFELDNIFVREISESNDTSNLEVKVSPFGLIQHDCRFCGEESSLKNGDDSFFTTDYCKHIRDLSLSLISIQLGLLKGSANRRKLLLAPSEVAQDEYRRESEALLNELMLKAFCGNAEYSVDADIKFPFKSLLAFKHHHFSPRSMSPSSLTSEDENEHFSVASEPPATTQKTAPPQTSQLGSPFQRAPSEVVYQSRTPSRTSKNGVNRSAASLRSAKSTKSLKSLKSARTSRNSAKSAAAASGTRWPLPNWPSTGQRVARVTEYGRFIYETSGKAIFEFTNGTGIVHGVCEIVKLAGDKQKVRVFKVPKKCPLPPANADLVKRSEAPEKEFDSAAKLDCTAICLYHMVCNDVEAYLSHTPAWLLRSPFALPSLVGIIMHNGDVHLTFADSGSIYYRRHDSSEITPKNGGPPLGDEQIEVFEAVSLLLEAHHAAWTAYPFIRSLKTDLACHLSMPTSIFSINPSYIVVPPPQQVHYNSDELYRESLEEFNRTAGVFAYGNSIPSTSEISSEN
uniref:PK_Tyr_Ser-Thr domain-containing protein n=1 Tax=Panagrellus redivivus TaxID=6233 RepID=A0A7E4V005_PANRE